MRTLEVASEMESGREKEVRSTSSSHGRRREKAWLTESERRDTKARKAGVENDGREVPVVVGGLGFEIGSVGGDDIDAIWGQSKGISVKIARRG